jgi:hypothetical protein
VIQLLEKPRDPALKYVFVDTPGQIEIFTWSASGQLITGAYGEAAIGSMTAWQWALLLWRGGSWGMNTILRAYTSSVKSSSVL